MRRRRLAHDAQEIGQDSSSRPALQHFLREWVEILRAMKSRVRWSLEVDPIDI